MAERPGHEEVLEELGVECEEGYLYYLDGRCNVMRSKEHRAGDDDGPKGPELVAKTATQKQEKGWIYYLNKEGHLARAPMGAAKPRRDKANTEEADEGEQPAPPAKQAAGAAGDAKQPAEETAVPTRQEAVAGGRVELEPGSYRCLSIRQPWADLILRGLKTIEVRTWQTKHRGPMLIHASKKLDEHGDTIARFYRPDHEWEQGCLVGVVELVDIEEHPTQPGQYLWKLERPRRVPLYEAKGTTTLYSVDWPPTGQPLEEPKARRSSPDDRTPAAEAYTALLTDEQVERLASAAALEDRSRASVASEFRHYFFSMLRFSDEDILLAALKKLGAKKSKQPVKNEAELIRQLRAVSFDDARDDLSDQFDDEALEDAGCRVEIEPGFAYGIGSDGLWKIGETEEHQLAERFPDDFDPAWCYRVDHQTGQVWKAKWLTYGELHELRGDPVR